MEDYIILTHPFRSNYGGFLQSYALHKQLNYLGIKNSVLQYETNDYKKQGLVYLMLLQACEIALSLFPFSRFMIFALDKFKYYYALKAYLSRNIFSSVKAEIRQTQESIKSLEKPYIVGSDQVWRASYTRHMRGTDYYFLKHILAKHRNRSIAYAASFGIDEWEGTPEETDACKQLLREFKAVSVREHDGIKLCKEILGVDAVQMPDPTLLLQITDYDSIINQTHTWLPSKPFISYYILDDTKQENRIIEHVSEITNLPCQPLFSQYSASKRRNRFPITVSQWLRLIRDCEYFITDSFHGCVFAIIYNKPFVCLGNEGRGNSRFDSLLDTFGLEDRFVTDATPEKVLQVLNTPIYWERVNAIHDTERERGINFLKENLSES